MMKGYPNILLLIILFGLLLAACSAGSSPLLAVPGEPTLVYIYTDN